MLLRALGPALRIRAFLRAVQFTAHCVNGGPAIGRQAEAGDGLSVVFLVVSDLARGAGEVGTVGDPHVAHSFGVEDPGHTAAMLGSHEFTRKRRAQNLLDCERGLRLEGGGGGKEKKRERKAKGGRSHSALV